MQLNLKNAKNKSGQALLEDAVNLFDSAVKSIDLAEEKLKAEITSVDSQIAELQERNDFHKSDLSRAARIKEKLLDFIR